MFEALPQLDVWRRQGTRAALATVVAVSGSSPRPAGAQRVIAEDGTFAGSISVGCVEAAVFDDAVAVLQDGTPRARHFGIADEDGIAVGLSCGGQIDVWIEPNWLDDARLAAVVTALQRSIEQVSGGCLVSVLATTGPKRCVFVHPDGSVTGSLNDAVLDQAVTGAALQRLITSESGVETLADNASQAQRVFFDVQTSAPTLLIFGGTQVAMALVPLAKRVGFHTIVADGRQRFAEAARFPDADRVLCVWPADITKHVTLMASTYVVVLNHDPKFDLPSLQVALASPARYVGAIGSRRTHEQQRRRLRESGVDVADIERVHGPVGLDIGARTPEEVAVSILAELIAVRYGRPGGMLYNQQRMTRDLTPSLASANAVGCDTDAAEPMVMPVGESAVEPGAAR